MEEITKESVCPKCQKVCGPWKVIVRHFNPEKRGPKKKGEK